ncbi:MAG: HPr family phosphocarrier protein [Lachnospiraceae bacterium]|nr:HPr family phosphocarrier protein [Lachnospiraceae bacterium]MBQ8165859.1 HPr family phosphocarrier protein [Lachnospiraceae bacterium]
MISRDVVVNLQADATARPVAVLVQLASKYESKVYIVAKDKKINAKSIMGMMSLGFGQGDKLTIQAEGNDAEDAVKEIADYIESVA